MITFEEKVEAMIMFNRQIGERKAAEFAVRLDDVVENLGRNNESFVQAFREMLAAEHGVQLTASGVGVLARFGKLLVRLGWWLAKIGGN